MRRHVVDVQVCVGSLPLITDTPFKPLVRNRRKDDRATEKARLMHGCGNNCRRSPDVAVILFYLDVNTGAAVIRLRLPCQSWIHRAEIHVFQ